MISNDIMVPVTLTLGYTADQTIRAEISDDYNVYGVVEDTLSWVLQQYLELHFLPGNHREEGRKELVEYLKSIIDNLENEKETK